MIPHFDFENRVGFKGFAKGFTGRHLKMIHLSAKTSLKQVNVRKINTMTRSNWQPPSQIIRKANGIIYYSYALCRYLP